MNKKLLIFISIFLLFCNISFSEIVNKIKIEGNVRISSETINIFSQVSVGDDLGLIEIDSILKKIYSTGFFEDVKIILKKQRK